MNLKLITIITIIVSVICVGFFQFYSQQLQQIYKVQPNLNGSKNSTDNIDVNDDKIGSILNDLNKIPDSSSLNNEVDSLNKNIEGF